MKIAILDSGNVFAKSLISSLRRSKHKLIPLSYENGFDFMNPRSTQNALAKSVPDFIYNFASYGGGLHYVAKYPADVVHKNMQMVLNLYKAVSFVCPKARIINTLANCSYPEEAIIQRESEWFGGQVHESVYAYGNVKRMQYVVSYCYKKQYGIKSINFIIPNHYGPGDYTDPVKVHAIDGMIIRMIMAKREEKKYFEIWGTGKPVREWGFIDDIVRVLMKALTTEEDLTYPVNIGQNKGYSVSESAKLIAKAVGFRGKLIFNTKYQDGAPKKVLDDKKFRKLFPKFKFTDHYEGILETVKYYESVL